MIKIVIAEGNELLRLGLKAALDGSEGMKVLGDYASIDEMYLFLSAMVPDLALVCSEDLAEFGPTISGYLDAHSPGTKILALCENARDEELFAVFGSGASGYVLEGSSIEELIGSIKIVASGGMCFDPRVVSRLVTRQIAPRLAPRLAPSGLCISELTKRETLILEWLIQGCTNLEIGNILSLSRSTVRNNITQIMNKLRVQSRVELAVLAVLQGIVSNGVD